MRMNLKLIFLWLASVFALVACSDSSEDVAGTVTDTGNTIAQSECQVSGVVSRVDGSPAQAALVRMARTTIDDTVLHIPERLEVLTDSEGVFSFDSALADTFQLAVIDTSAVEVFFLPRTTLQSGSTDSIQLAKAEIVLKTCHASLNGFSKLG